MPSQHCQLLSQYYCALHTNSERLETRSSGIADSDAQTLGCCNLTEDIHTCIHTMLRERLISSFIVMRPAYRGHIKRCTPSVCPPVCPVPTMHSKLDSRRDFKFSGDMNLRTRNWRSKFEVKRSKGTNMQKSCFMHIFVESG